MCGSTDLIKKDGIFECQSCGTKYSVEEAKKMMVEGTVDVSGSSVKIDNSDKLELEIKPYSALPCALEVFKINGQDADLEDFGSTCTCGDCMLSECCSDFEKIKPTNEVLQKYGISGSQFYQICDELKEELHVAYCGWCS